MFVARYTTNPQGDIKRGWSAYMGHRAADIEVLAYMLIDHTPATEQEVDEAIAEIRERFDVEECQGDDDAEIALAEMCDEWISRNLNSEGERVEWDAHTSEWCHVHHNGLSCWSLDAETAEEAIAEAAELATAGKIEWAGFGDATEGHVTYVAPVPGVENLHVFECNGTISE